ncbi:hypothetical protein D4764_15G0010800 [Takifugu flavidus]|uniref:Im:7138239 n=1 Tax=Takifugu flavidus TaxID=433684 RepID=A0A5C6P1L5_9TELE|nr:hypothetical protein D4764_15G0010800 [Takifugu flavidus]
MDVPQPFLLLCALALISKVSKVRLMSVLYFLVTGGSCRHIDHRNLFTQRMCCKRQSHFVYIGQDISGSPVSIDVGLCRSHCGSAPRSSPETGQQEYSKHSSMLEFLRSKKLGRRGAPESPEPLGQLPSCGLNMMCEPSGMRVDRVLLFEGAGRSRWSRSATASSGCPSASASQRSGPTTPRHRTRPSSTSEDAPNQRGGRVRVSVRACLCGEAFDNDSDKGFSCLPTKFDSALVETPNKSDLIQTVTACELKESCYRIPFIEYYYEIVHHANGVKEERLKEIDVGRCLGGCTTGNRCLLRSPSDPEICRLWSDRQSSSCVPQGYESHSFLNQHGQMRTVLSITSCKCHK